MYGIGILLAVLSGTAHNLGNVLQKKAVNDLPRDRDGRGFYAALVRRPLWLAGLLVQMFVGATCLLLAQLYIGPALIPGLMATGLITLTVGSILIVGEQPTAAELAGIGLLIAAVTLLGLSRLIIDVRDFDFFRGPFLWRTALFTGAYTAVVLLLEGLSRRDGSPRALLHAFLSGCLFAVSNFWTGLIAGALVHLFRPPVATPEVGLFLAAAAVLIPANLFGIARTQTAFRTGRASRVVPIQLVPIQLTPVLVYLALFQQRPPTPQSLALAGSAVLLILASSLLLARRQGLNISPH